MTNELSNKLLMIDLKMSKYKEYRSRVRRWAKERMFLTVSAFQPTR